MAFFFPLRRQSGQSLAEIEEYMPSLRNLEFNEDSKNMALGVFYCFDSLKKESTKAFELWVLHLAVGVISLNCLNIDSIF